MADRSTRVGVRDAMRQVTLTVTIVPERRVRLGLWLFRQSVKVAAWLMNCEIRVQGGTEHDDPIC